MAISSTHQTDLTSPNNPAQQPGKKQSQSPQKKATTVLPFTQTPIPRSLAPAPPAPGPVRSGRNYRHEEILVHVAVAGHPEESSGLSAGRSKHG